ncbi:MAG TPA: hypothetical protein VNV35_20740 [Puia sp.]|jgi:hypothetical protein|nr:hypothetical protein [Puia sp.]
MLADRQFITEAGKLTTEGVKMEIEKCAQSILKIDEGNPPVAAVKIKKAGGRNHLRVT